MREVQIPLLSAHASGHLPVPGNVQRSNGDTIVDMVYEAANKAIMLARRVTRCTLPVKARPLATEEARSGMHNHECLLRTHLTIPFERVRW